MIKINTKVIIVGIAGFITIVFLNLLLLDYLIIKLTTHGSVLGVTTEVGGSCPKDCITQFNSYAGSTSASKEYFIPLGTGSSTAGDWIDVSGVQATIDTAQYPKIKSVIFEATVQVPTGNQIVWVRLYNKTDKHPVWFSEVSMSGAGPVMLESQVITLDKGSKIYQVQMKTQLQFTASLNQSRIHIFTY